MTKFFSQYRGTRKIWDRYWKTYGGWSALIKSPYLHLSILVTVLSWPTWNHADSSSLALSVLPNFLGFTMGGYALWLAVGDEKFKVIISRSVREKPSAFIGINAVFVHLIVIQVSCLTLAFIYSVHPLKQLPMQWKEYVKAHMPYSSELLGILTHIYSFLFTTLFVYSFVGALAVTMAVFRVASWYEAYLKSKPTEGADY